MDIPTMGLVCLMCVASHGYHPLVTYQWYRDDRILSGAVHPVHYGAQCGNYHCEVTIKRSGEVLRGCFVVSGRAFTLLATS